MKQPIISRMFIEGLVCHQLREIDAMPPERAEPQLNIIVKKAFMGSKTGIFTTCYQRLYPVARVKTGPI